MIHYRICFKDFFLSKILKESSKNLQTLYTKFIYLITNMFWRSAGFMFFDLQTSWIVKKCFEMGEELKVQATEHFGGFFEFIFAR